MAISELWQNISAAPIGTTQDWAEPSAADPSRRWRGTVKLWMAADAGTILLSAMLALVYERHHGAVAGVRDFFHGTLIHGRSLGVLSALLCWFTASLLFISRRLHLYTPRRLPNILHEQSVSVQACLASGLLLTGTLYLIHAQDIPRSIVLITVGLVTVTLSLRRLIYRLMLYRSFESGVGTRDVLIVGTGPEAQALRRQLESIRQLGYTFKGFIECNEDGSRSSGCDDVVGTVDTMFQHARRHFVDEIFFTAPGQRGIVKDILDQARGHGIDLRVVPDMYDGLAWNNPIEYVGQFPTIPLHCGHVPEIRLLLKRLLDVVLCGMALIVLSPVMLAIAIAIKLDSPGPAFYLSERIGKRGRVFPCIKFRTMVRDADKMRADVMHLNERDGVLFKVSNDPRITALGRLLRKYSLDELPQLFNVLSGDMSIVGPRPPIASEVREYKLSHLRRLDVTPGITGLWQVIGRQDPSFDSYISLDVTYIENWSILLDLVIILRTIRVVLAGTGS
jgi:exopolysaccharide biosynthesis polyprenyl glycosylphosphotransferase